MGASILCLTLARVYTEVLHFHFHPSHIQPSVFSRLLSVDRFTFSLPHFQTLAKIGIYFGRFSTGAFLPFTGLGGHTCPPIGHTCPPRPVQPAPWCVKGESGSAKLWCIRARGFFHASCIQTNLSHGSGWASPHRGAGFQPAGNGALCHEAGGEKRWSLMKVRTFGTWYSRAGSPRPRCGFTFKGEAQFRFLR